MEQLTHTTTDLEQQLTVNETQQVIEEEQRTTTVETSHVEAPIDNIYTMNDYSMSIEEVTARNILETPVIVKMVTWTTSNPVLTSLLTFNIPDIFTTLKNFHDTILSTYSVFKPTIKFHFKLNSTPFHQGKVICWYNPLNQLTTALSDKTVSLTSISMQPSVFLDASLANSGEIEIPFEFFKTFFNTNSDSGLPPMGSINITVFNPLSSATGSSTNATIQILLSCTELQTHIPIAPHDVLFSSFVPSGAVEAEAQGFMDQVMKGIGSASKFTSGIQKSGMDVYTNFKTGNYSGAVSSLRGGLGTIESTLKDYNLDKPADMDATTCNTIHPISPFTHMRGIDTSVRLGATPEGGYLTHNLFSSTSMAEHQISSLIKMKGFLNTVSWDVSQIPGTVLDVIPVAPWYQRQGQLVSIAGFDYQGFEQTFLSYLSNFYNFWRGSISLRWDFVSSKMHSGRLAFIFFPNNDPNCPWPASPTTLDLTLFTNNPIYYFDLAESKTAELTIPFQSGTPLKYNYSPFAKIQPTGPVPFEAYQTGTLAVVVVNQLMAPSSVSQNISYNTFIGAGPDMEFEAPYSGSAGYFYRDLGSPPPHLRQ